MIDTAQYFKDIQLLRRRISALEDLVGRLMAITVSSVDAIKMAQELPSICGECGVSQPAELKECPHSGCPQGLPWWEPPPRGGGGD